jgi:hypothetical protein
MIMKICDLFQCFLLLLLDPRSVKHKLREVKNRPQNERRSERGGGELGKRAQ